MSKNRIIGIDLGTTNSCVAFVDKGNHVIINDANTGERTAPSIVYYSPKDGSIAFGKAAEKKLGLEPEHTAFVFKRLMGISYQEYKEHVAPKTNFPYQVKTNPAGQLCIEIAGKLRTPIEISADFLRYLKGSAEKQLGGTITRAVITVPAYFNNEQRQATKDAGTIAGLTVERIINEPTAAALAYGLEKGDNKNILVFDLGGGTFDVTAMRIEGGVFEVNSTGGDSYLGGHDFTHKIVEYAINDFKNHNDIDLTKDKAAFARINQAAELAKKDLSMSASANISVPYIYMKNGMPLNLDVTISRSKFEDLISSYMSKTEKVVLDVLKKANWTKETVDRVVVVGGSTRIPKVKELLNRIFGEAKVDCTVNPDEVVAQGAAIQGSILMGDTKDLLLLDVIPLSLGIETKGGILTKLIEANATIPTKKSQVFTTADDNQTSVTIVIYQGERTLARDNKCLGQFELAGIASARAGVPQIEVTFDVDANGIINVSAKDKASGKECSIVVKNESLSEAEIKKMREEAEKHAAEDQEKLKLITAKNEAEGMIISSRRSIDEHKDKLPEDFKSDIETKIKDLESSITSDNLESIESATKALRDTVTQMYEKLNANGASAGNDSAEGASADSSSSNEENN